MYYDVTMIDVISSLHTLAEKVPLPFFAAIASFLDEVFPPIPSHVVFFLLGSLAQAQDASIPYMIVIASISVITKTIGAVVIFMIADKAEDVVLIRFGKQFGVTHEHVEKIGKKIKGNYKDYFFLTVVRMIPVIPGSVMSAVCGIVKIPLRVFTISTLIGSTLMCIFYMFLGNKVIDLVTYFL